jgi:hypothetical protein
MFVRQTKNDGLPDVIGRRAKKSIDASVTSVPIGAEGQRVARARSALEWAPAKEFEGRRDRERHGLT